MSWTISIKYLRKRQYLRVYRAYNRLEILYPHGEQDNTLIIFYFLFEEFMVSFKVLYTYTTL